MKVSRPVFPTPASPFTSARLLFRPMTLNDAAELHILRTQLEVMINSTTGKVDEDHDATRTWINRFIHPNDSKTFSFAIEELANPGVIVGTVGSHIAEPPSIGYMFRKEFWGKGYATEAAKRWIEEYWKLPRREIELQSEMPESSELHWEGDTVREVLIAHIEASNVGSRTVVGRCGFKPTGFEEKVEDFRGPAVIIHYFLERPREVLSL